NPAISSTGNAIAYAGTPEDEVGSHIFIQSSNGGQAQQLTESPNVSDSSPSFSPDGSEIVFARAHRYRPYSMGGWTWDDWDICTMKADGSRLQRVTQQKYYGLSTPQFSRDGKSIIYSAMGHGSRLPSGVFEVSLRGGKEPVELAKGRPQDYKS